MTALTGRSLLIQVAGTEYNAQVFAATVRSGAADSDDMTFAETAAGGGRAYKLAITMTQDMAATTLWAKIWDSAGTDAAITLKPYGNAVASAAQPHYTMTATIQEPDGDLIGGTANASPTARLKVEVEWPLLAKPTKVIA